ncbi:MAG: hypothetical protein ACLFTE_07085 [Salinivenus sp.]
MDSKTRCKGTRDDGRRCTHLAQEGSHYCFRHASQEQSEALPPHHAHEKQSRRRSGRVLAAIVLGLLLLGTWYGCEQWRSAVEEARGDASMAPTVAARVHTNLETGPEIA